MTLASAENLIMAQADTEGPDGDSALETGTGEPGAAVNGGADAHGADHGGSGIDPVHQFEIKRFVDLSDYGLDFLSFTNSSLFMVLAVALIGGFFVYAMRGGALVPTRMQSLAEMAYEFVAKIVRENSGAEGMKFFPFIFTLFFFILTLNMLGMIPFSFTVTSHIVVTFALALMVLLVVTVVGVIKHGAGFLRLFAPSGAPVALLPLLIVIEVISYLIRPVSLSVRLFANMLAGHMMLKVFASFVVALGVVGGWVPLLFMVPFTGLEILIAFLQAFVFTVLSCIYLNDALHLHDH